MGLDVYAGSLSRYYSGNWKSSVQQWAEENGVEFRRITPGAEEETDEAPSAEELQPLLEGWRDALLRSISPEGAETYAAWVESSEAEYYTDKPDYTAYWALLLYWACKEYGIDVPKTVPRDWDEKNFEEVQRAMDDPHLNWSFFIGAEWWVPLDECLLFGCEAPNGRQIMAGTIGVLFAELERINEFEWQASPEEILNWQKSEGYPAELEFENGEFNKLAEHDVYEVEPLAKFAYSIFYQAALFSKANRVPILLDF